MDKLTLLSLVILAFVALSSAASNDTTTTTSALPTKSTATEAPTSSTKTEAPTTKTEAPTTVPPTTKTEAPTTANTTKTEAPTTKTEAPTTAPPTTKTEAPTTANTTKTEAPTTKTEAPTTANTTVTEAPTTETPTTAAPTLPTRSTVSPISPWYVEDPKTKDKCILAQFQLQFTVPYSQTWDNKTYMATASFALPQNATVDKAGSSCSAGVTTQQQLLKLQFASGTVLHNVTVRFSRANETANVNVDEIAFEYDLSDTTKFVNASKTDKPLQRAFSDQEYVSIPKDNYYSCDSAEPAALKNEELNLTVTASFSGVKAEAFRTSNSSDFNGTQFICPFDHTTPMPVTTTPAPVTRATYNLTVANKTCLMAWFQMSLMVKYNTTDKKVAMHTFNSTDTIGTVNAKMSSCDNKTATLFVDGWIDDGWSFALDFAMADNKFSLSHVQVNFTLKDSKTFVNASDDGKPHVSETNFTKWAATVGHSYTCKDSDVWSLNVDEFKNFVPELSITLSNIQVQAFMSADAVKPEFGTAEDCSYTSDIVPIAVGCALALLVVIVLIAYVIGRRRNRARGYESM